MVIVTILALAITALLFTGCATTTQAPSVASAATCETIVRGGAIIVSIAGQGVNAFLGAFFWSPVDLAVLAGEMLLQGAHDSAATLCASSSIVPSEAVPPPGDAPPNISLP